jgi:hypothetical protein
VTVRLQRILGPFHGPQDIAVRNDGTRLAMVEALDHRVRWAAYPGAAAFSSFGSYASDDTGFAFPQALAFDAAGNLLVLDQWNRRVVRLVPSGNGYAFDAGFALAAGMIHGGVGLGVARDLVLDGAGAVLVLDPDHARILRYDGVTSAIPLPPLRAPWGLAVRPGGGAFVVDREGHEVVAVSAAGAVVARFGRFGRGPGQLRNPEHVLVAPSGSLWVADAGNHRIEEFTVTGDYVGTVVAAPRFRQLRRLRSAPNGRVLVADPAGNAVYELADAVPARALELSLPAVDFGDCGVGSTTTTSLTIHNVGSQPITVDAVDTTGPPFKRTLQPGGLPQQVAPAGTVRVNLEFAPTDAGPWSGALEVRSDAVQDRSSISLAGNALRTFDPGIVVVVDPSLLRSPWLREIVRLPVFKRPGWWPPSPRPPVPPGPPPRDREFRLGLATSLGGVPVRWLGTPEEGTMADALAWPFEAGDDALDDAMAAGRDLIDRLPAGNRTYFVLAHASSVVRAMPELPADVDVRVVAVGPGTGFGLHPLAERTERLTGGIEVAPTASAMAEATDRVVARSLGWQPVSAGYGDFDDEGKRSTVSAAVVRGDRFLRWHVVSDRGPVPELEVHDAGGRRLEAVRRENGQGVAIEVALDPAGRRGLVTLSAPRQKRGAKSRLTAQLFVHSDLVVDTHTPTMLQGPADEEGPRRTFLVGDRFSLATTVLDRGRAIEHERAVEVDPPPSKRKDEALVGGMARRPGLWTSVVTVTGRDASRFAFARTSVHTALVMPEVSASASDVYLSAADDAGHRRLRIVPRDRFGRSVGAGLADVLSFVGDGLEVVGRVHDVGDGSYAFDVATNVEADRGRPMVTIALGPGRARIAQPEDDVGDRPEA